MTLQAEEIEGATVRLTDNQDAGTVGLVFNDEDGQPVFVQVQTDDGNKIAPLDEAKQEDGALVLPYSTQALTSAPDVAEDDSLSDEGQQTLRDHFEQSSDTGEGQKSRTESGDVSGPDTDTAITRSEQELQVGTEEVEAGRARITKEVVEEEVTQTVPVKRERLKVEREPIDENNEDAATSGPEISGEEHEIVLHEEQPRVEKVTVPKERIRLGTEEVTEEETVTDTVSKEEVHAPEEAEEVDSKQG